MDTTKIDTNSLLNLGVDANLHPLLASTSLLPGIPTATQNQLIAPVDPLLVGYNVAKNIILYAAAVTTPAQPIHSFAIQAGGTVTFNAKSDLDGNPLDLSDDAFVYAGKGFILNGTSILPVQRDAAGNALTDSTGKLRLIDQAVVLAPGYLEVKTNSNTNYTNLNPPQIVATQPSHPS